MPSAGLAATSSASMKAAAVAMAPTRIATTQTLATAALNPLPRHQEGGSVTLTSYARGTGGLQVPVALNLACFICFAVSAEPRLSEEPSSGTTVVLKLPPVNLM